MCVGRGRASPSSWVEAEARKALFSGRVCSPLAHEVYLIHAPLDGPLPSTHGILLPVAFGARQIGFDFNHASSHGHAEIRDLSVRIPSASPLI